MSPRAEGYFFARFVAQITPQREVQQRMAYRFRSAVKIFKEVPINES